MNNLSVDRYFTAYGYAVVKADVRGSGASFGPWPFPWSPDEITDGAELVDWIVRQPWSNGKVGAFGTSYLGATSEFLLVNRHPAVKGYGYMAEQAIEHYFRDAWAIGVDLGTEEEQKDAIAEIMLGPDSVKK